jgi:ABC-type transport system substrate-binding protein
VVRTYSRREALRLASGVGMLASGGWLGAACGGDSDGGSSATPPPTVPRATAPPGERSGRLRLGVLREEGFPTQPFNRLVEFLSYSRLVAVDPRSATVHPDLASTFEVVEPLEVRFTLRPGLFFHADIDDLAVPVTAELIQRDFEQRAAEGSPLFNDVVDQIEAPDEVTLVLRLRAPFAFLFDLLASVDAGIRGENRYAAFPDPVGSGPFTPAGQDSTGHALLANPRYHDAEYPRLERVNVLHYADEGDIDRAFLGSEIDVRHHPDAESRDRALDRPDVQQVDRPARALRGLGLSLLPSKGGVPTVHVEAFQDERVRRAVSIALDRGALAEIEEGVVASPVGAAHRAVGRADSLPPSELSAHPLYQHNPPEATKLLQAAGHERISFRLLASESAGSRAYTTLVERQLRAAGFEALLRLEDHSAWEQAFFAGNFEATLFELSGLDTPDVGLTLHRTGGLDGRFSLWGYSNPVFDASTNAALSELVPDRRAAAIREAQRVLLEEAPGMFPLVTPIEVASIGSRVNGYRFDAFDFNPGWLAAEWERPA